MPLLPTPQRPWGRGHREGQRFRVRRTARVRDLLGPDNVGIRQSLVALGFSSFTAVVVPCHNGSDGATVGARPRTFRSI